MKDLYFYKRFDGSTFVANAKPAMIEAYNSLNEEKLPVPVCLGRFRMKKAKPIIWFELCEEDDKYGGSTVLAKIYVGDKVMDQVIYNPYINKMWLYPKKGTKRAIETIQTSEENMDRCVERFVQTSVSFWEKRLKQKG